MEGPTNSSDQFQNNAGQVEDSAGVIPRAIQVNTYITNFHCTIDYIVNYYYGMRVYVRIRRMECYNCNEGPYFVYSYAFIYH